MLPAFAVAIIFGALFAFFILGFAVAGTSALRADSDRRMAEDFGGAALCLTAAVIAALAALISVIVGIVQLILGAVA